MQVSWDDRHAIRMESRPYGDMGVRKVIDGLYG